MLHAVALSSCALAAVGVSILGVLVALSIGHARRRPRPPAGPVAAWVHGLLHDEVDWRGNRLRVGPGTRLLSTPGGTTTTQLAS